MAQRQCAALFTVISTYTYTITCTQLRAWKCELSIALGVVIPCTTEQRTCLLAIAVVRSGTPAGDPGPAAEPDKSAACSPLGRSGRVKSLWTNQRSYITIIMCSTSAIICHTAYNIILYYVPCLFIVEFHCQWTKLWEVNSKSTAAIVDVLTVQCLHKWLHVTFISGSVWSRLTKVIFGICMHAFVDTCTHGIVRDLCSDCSIINKLYARACL